MFKSPQCFFQSIPRLRIRKYKKLIAQFKKFEHTGLKASGVLPSGKKYKEEKIVISPIQRQNVNSGLQTYNYHRSINKT